MASVAGFQTLRPTASLFARPSSSCASTLRHRYPSSQRFASSSASSSSASLSFPSHLSNPSPYDIFHLPRSSSSGEVKSRYYDLVKTLHPDRRIPRLKGASSSSRDRSDAQQHGSSSSSSSVPIDMKGKGKAATTLPDEEQVKEEFRLVVKAYQLLSDSSKRAQYDRLGIGWDGSSSSASTASNPWGASDAEMAELRRRSQGWGTTGGTGAFYGWNSQQGHDTSGWQRYAQANSGFYARSSGPRTYPGAAGGSPFSFDPNYHPRTHGPRYASNKRFISVVAIVTWTLALLQFHRLSMQSQQAAAYADKRHLDAVKNLDEARVQAKSREGRQRLEALRRRAREERLERERDAQVGAMAAGGMGSRTLMQPAPEQPGAADNPWGVGHGGPSGRAQHDSKRREASARSAAVSNDT